MPCIELSVQAFWQALPIRISKYSEHFQLKPLTAVQGDMDAEAYAVYMFAAKIRQAEPAWNSTSKWQRSEALLEATAGIELWFFLGALGSGLCGRGEMVLEARGLHVGHALAALRVESLPPE